MASFPASFEDEEQSMIFDDPCAITVNGKIVEDDVKLSADGDDSTRQRATGDGSTRQGSPDPSWSYFQNPPSFSPNHPVTTESLSHTQTPTQIVSTNDEPLGVDGKASDATSVNASAGKHKRRERDAAPTWECPQCTFANGLREKSCWICGCRNPQRAVGSGTGAGGGAGVTGKKRGRPPSSQRAQEEPVAPSSSSSSSSSNGDIQKAGDVSTSTIIIISNENSAPLKESKITKVEDDGNDLVESKEREEDAKKEQGGGADNKEPSSARKRGRGGYKKKTEIEKLVALARPVLEEMQRRVSGAGIRSPPPSHSKGNSERAESAQRKREEKEKIEEKRGKGNAGKEKERVTYKGKRRESERYGEEGKEEESDQLVSESDDDSEGEKEAEREPQTPTQGEWMCPQCTMINSESERSCFACMFRRQRRLPDDTRSLQREKEKEKKTGKSARKRETVTQTQTVKKKRGRPTNKEREERENERVRLSAELALSLPTGEERAKSEGKEKRETESPKKKTRLSSHAAHAAETAHTDNSLTAQTTTADSGSASLSAPETVVKRRRRRTHDDGSVSAGADNNVSVIVLPDELWECPQCTFHNKHTFRKCEMCNFRLPHAIASSISTAIAAAHAASAAPSTPSAEKKKKEHWKKRQQREAANVSEQSQQKQSQGVRRARSANTGRASQGYEAAKEMSEKALLYEKVFPEPPPNKRGLTIVWRCAECETDSLLKDKACIKCDAPQLPRYRYMPLCLFHKASDARNRRERDWAEALPHERERMLMEQAEMECNPKKRAAVERQRQKDEERRAKLQAKRAEKREQRMGEKREKARERAREREIMEIINEYSAVDSQGKRRGGRPRSTINNSNNYLPPEYDDYFEEYTPTTSRRRARSRPTKETQREMEGKDGEEPTFMPVRRRGGRRQKGLDKPTERLYLPRVGENYQIDALSLPAAGDYLCERESERDRDRYTEENNRYYEVLWKPTEEQMSVFVDWEKERAREGESSFERDNKMHAASNEMLCAESSSMKENSPSEPQMEKELETDVPSCEQCEEQNAAQGFIENEKEEKGQHTDTDTDLVSFVSHYRSLSREVSALRCLHLAHGDVCSARAMIDTELSAPTSLPNMLPLSQCEDNDPLRCDNIDYHKAASAVMDTLLERLESVENGRVFDPIDVDYALDYEQHGMPLIPAPKIAPHYRRCLDTVLIKMDERQRERFFDAAVRLGGENWNAIVGALDYEFSIAQLQDYYHVTWSHTYSAKCAESERKHRYVKRTETMRKKKDQAKLDSLRQARAIQLAIRSRNDGAGKRERDIETDRASSEEGVEKANEDEDEVMDQEEEREVENRDSMSVDEESEELHSEDVDDDHEEHDEHDFDERQEDGDEYDYDENLGVAEQEEEDDNGDEEEDHDSDNEDIAEEDDKKWQWPTYQDAGDKSESDSESESGSESESESENKVADSSNSESHVVMNNEEFRPIGSDAINFEGVAAIGV